MPPERISINLYSLRDHLKTADDVRRTIGKVAAIGFGSVQLSGIDPDLLTPSEIRRICADAGVRITSTHEPAQRLLEDPAWSIDRLHALGVTFTAYPTALGNDLSNDAAVDRWLARLDATGHRLREAGITLCYHNHHLEFTRSRGRPLLERIFAETSLAGEPDTYWIQLGGGNPLAWVRRWADAGRLPLIHLKDLRITATGETQFAELGAGGLDLQPIIAVAAAANCHSLIIEQDQFYGRDPFVSLAESFRFLNESLG